MAKIPFEIKYRPDIESGECKVETRDGRPVRIVCWDRTGGYPIMALATDANGNESYINCDSVGRKTIHSPSDLYIITPEPEMSEFEKEPKPAELSEKDKRMIQSIITNGCVDDKQEHWLRLLPERICRTKQKWSDEDKMNLNGCICSLHQYGYMTYADFLKHLPERFNLQPKQEWSEEDNIGWDEAFACVTRAEKAAKSEEELQNAVTAERWLKEIKFMYCVHPVKQEWSEEDLQHKSWILECLADGEKKMPEYAEDFQAAYKWLKSLRHKPHWKPSEEQMKHLKRCFSHEHTSQLPNQCILVSLYNDLTKLM